MIHYKIKIIIKKLNLRLFFILNKCKNLLKANRVQARLSHSDIHSQDNHKHFSPGSGLLSVIYNNKTK